MIRSVARHDRRALKDEAERNPEGLARWAHATESWMHGEVAAARRSAEIELQTRPDDFDLIRICLDYHIRARDSAQIYAYAKRLLAAKNPAASLRFIYAAESVILWPLWLLGYKGGRGVKEAADNCDRWVAWSRDYVAKHSAQYTSTESADAIPFAHRAIAVAARTLARHAWMTASIEVSVDGNHILTTGALKSVIGSSEQTFIYEGKSHDAVLKWGSRSFRSIAYTLEIDGSLVETSRVHVSNWWVRYWPLAAGLGLGALAYVLQR
ncbi:MAG: hypothetical protein WAU49_18365 [Steroidobacteraceae bacterium]